MRNRWEDKGGEVDEPVTITGKELRALKRGASLGFFALILSLVAVGAAGWTIYQGTKTAPILPEAAATPAASQADTATTQPASTAPEGTPTASVAPARPPRPARPSRNPARAGTASASNQSSAETAR